MTQLLRPINWDRIEDQTDLDVWNRLTSNLWLDTKIPIAGDLPSWRKMSEDEQDLVKKVFAGLTLLDTVQGSVGAPSMIPDALTPHEEAVYTYISWNESVHAKSYSTILTTLTSTEEIDAAFKWSEENTFMQKKAQIIFDFYTGNDPLKRKVASVLMESINFYSGFYTPFYFSSRGMITNAGDIISLILRDEALHQFYVGYKFQKYQDHIELPSAERAALKDEVYDLVQDILENESKYTETLYDKFNLTSDVKAYVRYNANRALMALGYEALYSREDTKFDASIQAYMDPTSNQTHDFFSGSGSSYQMITADEMDDSDWDF